MSKALKSSALWVGESWLLTGGKIIFQYMSNVYSDFHKAISKKLGWDDMLASVALPAIDCIIAHHSSHICDCTGDVLDDEDVAESLLQDSWTPDDIFSKLVSPDYQIWERDKDFFTSLRFEIESFMRSGDSYQEAIAEWWK